jgi:hypothetical protein
VGQTLERKLQAVTTGTRLASASRPADDTDGDTASTRPDRDQSNMMTTSRPSGRMVLVATSGATSRTHAARAGEATRSARSTAAKATAA